MDFASQMNITNICNLLIEYAFYALFFFVPLVFASDTSELFEFNKMWLTFGITIIIAGAWGIKSVLQKRILLYRTPLDIPIGLFLLSQIISTIFSLDTHVSLWGYYSRFNGGLFSIISYIFLYYAFVSNFINNNQEDKPFRIRLRLFLGGLAAIIAGFFFFYFFEKASLVFNTSFLKLIFDYVKTLFFLAGFIGALFLFTKSVTGNKIQKLFTIILTTGAIVALWGILSHFNFDLTCLLFRGTTNTSCWTEAFKPQVRIFSTLGQPNWLAAYLAILLPVSIAMFLENFLPQQKSDKKNNELRIMNYGLHDLTPYSLFFILYSILTYIAILLTNSRSGFFGLLAGLLVFLVLLKQKREFLKFVLIPLLIISLLIGTPLDQQIKQFTEKFMSKTSAIPVPKIMRQPQGSALESGGTESGTIRLIVWRGAIDAWLHNPLIGTGVETFAYSYYKYRPAKHNLTSEWDYLYNKAHNEYLNYLSTTGIFGLGSYLLMIGYFLFLSIKEIKNQKSKIKIANQNAKFKEENPENYTLYPIRYTLIIALLAGYVSILVSNFLGFSVVVMNIFLFTIPAFVFVLTGQLNPNHVFSYPRHIPNTKYQIRDTRMGQWIGIFCILLTTLYLILILYRFWQADRSYALGQNLNLAAEYQHAYLPLALAFDTSPNEPTFQDELSYNTAALAVMLSRPAKDKLSLQEEKLASYSAKLTQEALTLSNNIVADHPNNIVFWKTRVRMLYLLSELDPTFLSLALDAIKHAHQLAPTDAKVSYSLAILYGQNNNTQKAIEQLLQTIQLKSDYREAYYALGLFYHDNATDKNGRITNPQLQQKAVETIQYILDHFSSSDAQATQTLKVWNKL